MRAFLMTGIALLAVAATGCGGDDETTVAGGATTQRQPTVSVGEPTTEASTPTTEAPTPTTDRDLPATTAEDDEPTTTAEDHGGAASSADEQAAQETATGFLRALAGGDGGEACSVMTEQIRAQVEKSLSQAPGFKGKDCAEILGAVAKNYPDQVRRSMANIQVVDVTVNGSTASVSYKTGTLPKAQVPLVRVDGEWRIGALATPGGTG